jgi:hypothetical protein
MIGCGVNMHGGGGGADSGSNQHGVKNGGKGRTPWITIKQ